MENLPRPRVDVIICCRNERRTLPALFESLLAQTVDPKSFGVVFVDNGSTDGSREIAKRYAGRLNLTCVREERTGLNFARNTGFENSTGEYVAYLDADVRANANWMRSVLDAIEREAPCIAGGPCFPYRTFEPPAWFRDEYHVMTKGDRARYLAPDEFVLGGNMIWKRSAIERIGGFDNSFRGVFWQGDEGELMVRARKMIDGCSIYYDPGIAICHAVKPVDMVLRRTFRRRFFDGFNRIKIWHARPEMPAPKAARKFARTLIEIVWQTAVAFTIRDRKKCPYWQNHVHEHVFGMAQRLGNYARQMLDPFFEGCTKKHARE